MSLKPSKACMNLLGYDSNDVTSIESSNSSESISETLVITQLQCSDSVASLHSIDDKSSVTNLLIAPNVSSSSLVERFQAVVGFKIDSKGNSDEPKKDDATNYRTVINGFGFTRDELMKRLDNLVKKSVKNFNNDCEVSKFRNELNRNCFTDIHFR